MPSIRIPGVVVDAEAETDAGPNSDTSEQLNLYNLNFDLLLVQINGRMAYALVCVPAAPPLVSLVRYHWEVAETEILILSIPPLAQVLSSAVRGNGAIAWTSRRCHRN